MVHVMLLVIFRNRHMVLRQWTWSYMSYDKGLRSIVAKPRPRWWKRIWKKAKPLCEAIFGD